MPDPMFPTPITPTAHFCIGSSVCELGTNHYARPSYLAAATGVVSCRPRATPLSPTHEQDRHVLGVIPSDSEGSIPRRGGDGSYAWRLRMTGAYTLRSMTA